MLEGELARRLAVPRLAAADQDVTAVLDLTITLIADETVRVFDDSLREADLPELPARHRAAAYRAARALAARRNLVSCLTDAAYAVEHATKAARASVPPGRHTVSIYALHRLINAERWPVTGLRRMWETDNPAGRAKLSGLTWQLFQEVFGMKPMDASLARVSEALGWSPESGLAADQRDKPISLDAPHWDQDLEARRCYWATVPEQRRALLQKLDDPAEALATLAMAAWEDTLDGQEEWAGLALWWLLQHPSETSVIFLKAFLEEYGPFSDIVEMEEALIRMCANEVVGRSGFLLLHEITDAWAEQDALSPTPPI